MRATLPIVLLVLVAGCGHPDTGTGPEPAPAPETVMAEADTPADPTPDPETDAPGPRERVERTDDEWRERLTKMEYWVMREAGTERAFTGEYWNTKDAGTYHCRACDARLFVSDAKFDSGCGWPSFFEPLEDAWVVEKRDTSHGMVRTEVVCGRCDAHLGHVFPDGPPPTGLRYCINSVSIRLHEDGEEDEAPAEANDADAR